MKVVRTIVIEGPPEFVKIELHKAKVSPGVPFVRSNGIVVTEVERRVEEEK